MSEDLVVANAAAMAALRACGADRRDPLRWQVIEALARRAAGCDGEARVAVHQRLARWLAASATALDDIAAPPAPTRPPQPAGLAALAAHATAFGRAAPAPGVPPELRTLERFRGTWSRLAAEQRLHQSRASVPDNAGPLNSHRLVHRSLALMRTLSPAYLQRFVAHVDALLWLEQQAEGGAPAAGQDVLQAARERRRPRGR